MSGVVSFVFAIIRYTIRTVVSVTHSPLRTAHFCVTIQVMSSTVLQTFRIVCEFLPRTLRLGLCAAALLGICLAAHAQEPLRGPDVVIIAGKDKVIYEFRQNGQLRMVRVVPKWGKPYYLVPRDPTKGFGDLERADMLVPQWVIAEF